MQPPENKEQQMRLVEVVMLMGAHCVSPVEHSQMMTEAAKVQCAVVIEKDTDQGTLTVTPQEAATNPQVVDAIARFDAVHAAEMSGGTTRIVPAWAPAGSPTSEVKLPVARTPVTQDTAPPVATDVTANEGETTAAPQAAPTPPQVAQKVATLAPPPPKRAAAKTATVPKASKPAKAQKATATKPARLCKGATTTKWHITADGKKKYYCVKTAGDSTPDQLY
jgi:hypothetical protein